MPDSKVVTLSRRGTRPKGEKTRQKILAATLRVIASEGVRGTTHRVIAKEAGVQLSLTTYYFKDLNEQYGQPNKQLSYMPISLLTTQPQALR